MEIFGIHTNIVELVLLAAGIVGFILGIIVLIGGKKNPKKKKADSEE